MNSAPKFLPLALVALLAFAIPATSQAVPSAQDQYTEQPPTPGGEGKLPTDKGKLGEGSNGPNGSNGSGADGNVSGSQGGDELGFGTGGSADGSGGPGSGGSSVYSALEEGGEPGSTARAGVAPELKTVKDGNLGWGLPIMMVLVLAGAVWFLVAKRRSASQI